MSDDDTDDERAVEHDLGGVAADLGGLRAFATPEENGRLVVDTLDAKGGPLVTLGVFSDLVDGRVLLEAERAQALADRLATAADDVEEHHDTE